jgi:Ion channel
MPRWLQRGQNEYTVVLAAAFGILIVAPFERHGVRPLIVVLLGFLLVFAMWTSGVGKYVLGVTVILGIASLAAVIINQVRGLSRGNEIVFSAVSATLAAASIVVIVRRLSGHLVVSVRTITGALSVYLLLGIFYTYLYVMVGDIQNNGFFAQTGPHTPVIYLYFSFVTLTTVGYGDFSAGTDVGRMLAVVEALVGQLYLVTVVAIVIGNIGRLRHRPNPGDPD